MKKDELKQYLKEVKKSPIFKKVPQEAIEKLLLDPETKVLRLKEGEVLDGKGMYIIVEGRVDIEQAASDGRYVKMNLASAPAPVNVASALKKKTDAIKSRMRMEEDGCLIRISGKTLEQAVFDGGQLALNITGFLTDRIGFLNKRIVSLAGYSASSRLGMYLKENRHEDLVEIPMSITDFAEYLGVGRASLYRALDQMEKAGKIRCEGRKIWMMDDEE